MRHLASVALWAVTAFGAVSAQTTQLDRDTFEVASVLKSSSAAGAIAIGPLVRGARAQSTGGQMYGLISKINAVPGQRDALATILLEGTKTMPGCLSYVIAADPADEKALWITEVWDSQASHQASLSLPAVQAAVAKGRTMIAGFSSRVETTPIGGYGIPQASPR